MPGRELRLSLLNDFARRTLRRGQKRQKLLLDVQVAIEIVKPQELPAFVDLQKPPLTVSINGEVEAAVGDTGSGGEGKYALFNFRRRFDALYSYQSLAGILAPIDRAFRVVK